MKRQTILQSANGNLGDDNKRCIALDLYTTKNNSSNNIISDEDFHLTKIAHR